MKILFTVMLLLCASIADHAFSGGSDGSEVLGKTEPKKGLFSNIKDFFSKEKTNENEIEEETPVPVFKDEVLEEMPLDCLVTPTVESNYISLTAINKNNNLLRKPGSPRRAMGEYIQINGKIIDEDCIPVSNAIIQIWQTDSTGNYEDEYALDSEWDLQDKNYDKNFAYSGTALTNNLGEFHFITLFPGMRDKEMAPHINMSVRHSDFEELATMMFFNKHPKNSIDRNLQSIAEEKRDLLIAKGQKLDPSDKTEGRVYTFIITLKGINKYRRY